MLGFLRLLGTVNAAIWLGALVSLTVVILPAVFSGEMRTLLTPAGRTDDAGYAGAVAMIIFSRFFVLQYVCGFLGVVHALAGSMYLGRPLKTVSNSLLLLVLALSLVGGFWLQPRIRGLHLQKYDMRASVAQKEKAARSLKIYHGVSEALNLVALAGLALYFWRVAHPNDPTRLAGLSHKFRG